MKYIEKPIMIRVDASFDTSGEVLTFRLWDLYNHLPKPPEIQKVFILIDGKWEEMFFNRVWGKSRDPEKIGLWLKQKTSKSFSAETGEHEYLIRYL